MISLPLGVAAAFSFAALVLQGIAIGLPTWAINYRSLSIASVGLFGAFDGNGGYQTWPVLLTRCLDQCGPLYTWQTAGQAGGAFLIMSLLALAVSLTCQVARLAQHSIPMVHAHNKLVQSVSCIAMGVAFAFGWFGWALWSSLRVFDGHAFGFAYFGCVCAYCLMLGALVMLLIDRSRADGYAPLVDHHDAELHTDFPVPPYVFHVSEMAVYSKWASPAAVRILFFLLCIYAGVDYITYTTDSGINSAQTQWARILLGFLYLLCFVFVSRVACELVMVVFVVKDRYMGKDLERVRQHQRAAAQHHHANAAAAAAPVQNDHAAPEPAAAPSSVAGGGYQAL